MMYMRSFSLAQDLNRVGIIHVLQVLINTHRVTVNRPGLAISVYLL